MTDKRIIFNDDYVVHHGVVDKSVFAVYMFATQVFAPTANDNDSYQPPRAA